MRKDNKKRKVTYFLIRIPVILSVIIFTTFAYAIWWNNQDSAPSTATELNNALNNSVRWLESNKNEIENSHNPALWWMLKEASDISSNPRLKQVYQHYKTGYLDVNPPNMWTPFFDRHYQPPLPDAVYLASLNNYQTLFIYSLSCNQALKEDPLVQKQLQPDYCVLHYLRPWCVTHQLMGVRLIQQRGCEDPRRMANLANTLNDKIELEMIVDFRVVDAYLQRVLMLAESGHKDRIKPVWIRHILSAQNPDGGWDDLHPLFPVSPTKYFGLTSMRLPKIGEMRSDFHATAQAVWLLALLLQDQEAHDNQN